MKVRALEHVWQTVGSIQAERVIGTVFEVSEEDAVAAEAAGLVKIISATTLPTAAKYRKTKVVKDMETK